MRRFLHRYLALIRVLVVVALGISITVMIAQPPRAIAWYVAMGGLAAGAEQRADGAWRVWMPPDAPMPVWQSARWDREYSIEIQSTQGPDEKVAEIAQRSSGDEAELVPVTDTVGWGVSIVQTGWPLRCLVSSYRWRQLGDRRIPTRGGRFEEVRPGFLGALERWFPTRPMPLGFAVNTLLFAALLYPFWFVGAWLIKLGFIPKGACPHCKYSLIGLPKDAVCPECGAKRGN